jgi:hypothetical protein
MSQPVDAKTWEWTWKRWNGLQIQILVREGERKCFVERGACWDEWPEAPEDVYRKDSGKAGLW